MALAWHYTSILNLPKIIADGCLRPLTIDDDGATPLLWLSTNQHFEPGACQTHATRRTAALAPHLQSRLDNSGWVRFGLHADDSRLTHWDTAWQKGGITQAAKDHLELLATQAGSRREEWRVTPAPLPLSQLMLQVRRGGSWHPADANTALTLAVEELRFLQRLSIAANFI